LLGAHGSQFIVSPATILARRLRIEHAGVGACYADEHHKGVSVALYSDSQLLVNQLSGTWRVKSARIRPLWSETRDLLDMFVEGRAVWVSREQNGLADRLSVDIYVSTLEAERKELAREVSAGMMRPGLYLADERHQVNVSLGVCGCRVLTQLGTLPYPL
jgi:hypothetical protein